MSASLWAPPMKCTTSSGFTRAHQRARASSTSSSLGSACGLSAATTRGMSSAMSATPAIAGMRMAMNPQYGSAPARATTQRLTRSDSGG